MEEIIAWFALDDGSTNPMDLLPFNETWDGINYTLLKSIEVYSNENTYFDVA